VKIGAVPNWRGGIVGTTLDHGKKAIREKSEDGAFPVVVDERGIVMKNRKKSLYPMRVKKEKMWDITLRVKERVDKESVEVDRGTRGTAIRRPLENRKIMKDQATLWCISCNRKAFRDVNGLKAFRKGLFD